MNVELCLYRKINFGLRRVSRHFKILITDISPDAESREEQDGANHFVVRPTMIELWPILCKDANKMEKKDFFYLFKPS